MIVTPKLRRLCIDLDAARENLSKAILHEMVVVALRNGINSMCFTVYGNTYEIMCVEVSSAELDELDQYYCDHVHTGGFQALWTPDRGWH